MNSQQDNKNHSQQNLFKMRSKLKTQFNRLEKELEKNLKGSTTAFKNREEFQSVVEKLNDFRKEIDSALGNFEDKIQDTRHNFGNILHDINERSLRASQAPHARDMEELDNFFTGLNPFNLRKKYHQFSLSVRSEEVDPFGYDPVFDNFVTPLFHFLYYKYWRVDTYGLNNVPSSGKALIVSNHSGTLPYDATMIKVALAHDHHARRNLRFLVEDFLFHFPFLGSSMNRFGGVRANPENAQRLLEADMPVAVFPEGIKGLGKPFSKRYQLARFGRGGYVRLCLKTRSPLIPTAIIGPEEIHPLLFKETFFSKMLGFPYLPVTPTFPALGLAGLIPLPSKWSIHFLSPIDFSQYGPGAENDRVLVNKMSRRVKAQIQDEIHEKLKMRKSIWFG